ncbi:MAG: FAD-dependent oxidoreductase [Armatimonadota bacterium]
MKENLFLTDAQLKAEIDKCEFCEEKPCKVECPANCSPADFIMAARTGLPQDYLRAAAEILENNPLGGVCGLVCPDKHCMAGCVRKKFDNPVNIPAVQATVIKKAKELRKMPEFKKPKTGGGKVAVLGAGPAGLSSAFMLSQKGYDVTVFEKEKAPGGMCSLIPDYRLPKDVLKSDTDYFVKTTGLKVKYNKKLTNPETLLKQGFKAVVVAAGLDKPYCLGVENEKLSISAIDYLKSPKKYKFKGSVAVVGGGPVAVDCAVTAAKNKAKNVEMFSLEKLSEMPLTMQERMEIFSEGISVSGRTKLTRILKEKGKIAGIETMKVKLKGKEFNLKNISDVKGTEQLREDFDHVIIAIGCCSSIPKQKSPKIFYAGDCMTGPGSVVEAVAGGKNAAIMVDAYLKNKKIKIKNIRKSEEVIPGFCAVPVSVETDFFGRKIRSPFILSAAPPSDGLEQMELAFKAGWAGGIMKTSFQHGPIHIPGEYMHQFDSLTYGNCDNVSGHLLDRVCKEIKALVKKYPDRLIMASTGGPVTGDDEADRAGWQANTRILEDAGVMGIEYSLSCPQGGDGTEGDIVSQNAALTARIIDWIMEAGDKDVPKLFKLTAAVTSIIPIARAIKEVLDRYPEKKAGITLANTFPTMIFRSGEKKEWEEGIVVGMSGLGVLPISYLTLSMVSGEGLTVSGNGGPMDYKQAADFLALGVNTVQFCTIAMKYGYDIIKHLESGLSHLMKERGIKSVDELRGKALPNPIKGFMELTPVKKISDVDEDICISCGNCTRCSYLAIELDKDKHPETDAEKCIGCSICIQRCISGALYMRERTKKELAALKED